MNIDDYDVIWDSPSADARGSMPLGNGDIALNAWVEEDGDLQFHIGKTDAWVSTTTGSSATNDCRTPLRSMRPAMVEEFADRDSGRLGRLAHCGRSI